jgi:hypothetical protein
MTYVSKIVFSAVLLGLSGCGLSKSDCLEGDWFGIGLRDGRMGELPAKIEKHRESCGKHEIAPDVDRWELGRQKGLLSYCTPDNAYDVGARGSRLKGSCPAASYAAMQPAYERGQKYHSINQQISDLENEKADLYQQLDAARLNDVPVKLSGSIHSRIHFINIRLGYLRLQLGRYARF